MTEEKRPTPPSGAGSSSSGAVLRPLEPAILESGEFQETLERALEMVVPVVADYAFVHLAQVGGPVTEVALRHRDPEKSPHLEVLLRELREPMTAPGSVIHSTIKEGKAQQVGAPTPPTPGASDKAGPDGLGEAIRRLGPRSFMVVPLTVGDAIVGSISFARFEDDRPYDLDDLRFAKAVAGQTGLAIAKVLQIEEVDQARKAALAASDEIRFQARLLESVGEALSAVDLNGKIVYWNKAAERLYGYTSEEALGRDLSVTAPADAQRPQLTEAMAKLSAGSSWTGEVTLRRRDGSHFPGQLTGTPFYGENGEPLGIIIVASDLSQRKELEGQLIQAQRLHAVGGLAGGVAHDLNNALTGIQGFTELILQDLPPTSGARGDLDEIRDAANRAAGLVQQLLAFSRRQLLQPTELDLNKVVQGLSTVLRRAVREDVELVHDLDEGLGATHADPRQIEQVVLNLVQNAVEAMPAGGRLTLATGNEVIDSDRAASFPYDVSEGAYVTLTVSDTGPGMPAKVRERAFEPFFTTKAPGQGPGLGLSTVYGIVKQSEGYVWIETADQRGTSIRVYLPRLEKAVADLAPDDQTQETLRILLVEDDEAVRTVVRRILMREGYDVMDAPNGKEALSVARLGSFDAIVTDVVMPEMNGHEMVRALREASHDVPVLFISGHTDDQVARSGIADGGYEFLAKPFTTEALIGKVRALLPTPAR
ncbi:MAG: hybrid sensor histidine kinase/response regulator [Longimicrobiales bacterium]